MSFVTNFLGFQKKEAKETEKSIIGATPQSFITSTIKSSINATVKTIGEETKKALDDGSKTIKPGENKITKTSLVDRYKEQNMTAMEKQKLSDQKRAENTQKIIKQQQQQINTLNTAVTNISNDLYGS